MDSIELLEKTKFLSEEGYKIVEQGSVQEPLANETVIGTIEPYSGEYGTGYIVRSVLSPGAQYHHYEIYIKAGKEIKTTITLQQDAHLEGGTYRLPTEDGHQSIYALEGAWYQAPAIDDQGNEYTVFWTLREGYDPETGDESDACDWDAPHIVVCGGRDVTDNVDLVLE